MLPFLDSGDDRVLSASYAGGRLYATLATEVVDSTGKSVAGAAYFVISTAFRGGALSAASLRQGYLVTDGNNLLKPAIAVDAKGRGAIVMSLAGPDYYPSAVFVPFENFAPASTIQLAAAGSAPEDGFTGYPGGFGAGIARWGDYSGAVVSSDGSIWMVTEYIPNAPRTEFANWGTYLIRYSPPSF